MADSLHTGEVFQPDGFHAGNVPLLQPPISIFDIADGIATTEDPFILSCLTNLLRVWSQSRHDMPYSFAEEVTISEVVRQPLTYLILEAEHLHRRRTSVKVPYHKEPISKADWPTNDLFAIEQITTGVFPADLMEETVFLPYREKVEACSFCEGAGQNVCGECDGAGTVICSECGGAQQIACGRCRGAGAHNTISGAYTRCDACNGRGTISCQRCRRGQMPCTCQRGRIKCDMCDGSGNLWQRWKLDSSRTTRSYIRPFLRHPWAIPFDAILSDTHEIYSKTWDWPLEMFPENPVVKELPEQLHSEINIELNQAFNADRPTQPKAKRISAARFRIAATFVYRATFEYRGQHGVVFIGGVSNQVFTKREPIKKASVCRKLKHFAITLFDKVMGNDAAPVDHDYLKAVRGGNSHLADTRGVVMSAAKLLQLVPQVTATGYHLAMETDDLRSLGLQLVNFEIDFEIDAQQELLLCIKHTIGEGFRDRFAEALALTLQLSFGRLALAEVPETGKWYFEIVERRLYQFVEPNHLARMLQAMTLDIARIAAESTLK